MKITRKSMFSGKITSMELAITEEQLSRWRDGGELVQTVFPDLSPDQREFLMTGITPEEWDAMFDELSEEDNGD